MSVMFSGAHARQFDWCGQECNSLPFKYWTHDVTFTRQYSTCNMHAGIKLPLSCSIEGEHSTPCKVLSDVPQGTVIAPLLFFLYINDIPNSITDMLRLYGHDALLYSIISLTADCINLQTDLSTLQKWRETWQKYLGITFDCHLSWKTILILQLPFYEETPLYVQLRRRYIVIINSYDQLWNIPLLSGHHILHLT